MGYMGLIIAAVAAAAIFVVLLLVIMVLYNGLVRARVNCDNAWAQIDVQLKRRYDLIPNLVETVKGYAGHEKDTLEAVIKARQQAVAITSDSAHAAQKADAENMISQALGRLFALQESYPELKADTNFRQLQEELTSTENKIGFSRQHFNDTVGTYEQKRQTFPTVLVAALFNFAKREFFELKDTAAREAPKVSFS